MGNTSNDAEVSIGEILVKDGNGKAVFACAFTGNHQVQLILQDQLGRSVLAIEYSVDESVETLNFDVSNLKAGNYHAWIYIKDKVFVRHFELEGQEDSGLLSRFRSFFK